jgi:hypothetical protein
MRQSLTISSIAGLAWRERLFFSNVLIFSTFMIYSPFYYSSKSVCSNYGIYSSLQCYGLLSIVFLFIFTFNHLIHRLADAGYIRRVWMLLPSVIALAIAFI